MAQIIINSKTHGQHIVLIDDADYEWLNKIKWSITKNNGRFYAKKASPPKQYMHRIIFGLSDSKTIVDHKDRNSLNNQRENIRIATRSQNNCNRSATGYSKYLGVFKRTDKNYSKRWQSKIVKNGIVKILGSFTTEEEAALAYNNAAREIHGEFANFNAVETITHIHGAGD